MAEVKLGAVEAQFAEIIWEHEPLSSTELVKLAGEKLGWKKSTTYTILKRLCQRELFQNEGGTVTSLLSKEEFAACQSEQFVEETFDGSLPAFVAAFTTRKKLSQKEYDQLQALIDERRREST